MEVSWAMCRQWVPVALAVPVVAWVVVWVVVVVPVVLLVVTGGPPPVSVAVVPVVCEVVDWIVSVDPAELSTGLLRLQPGIPRTSATVRAAMSGEARILLCMISPSR